LYNLNFGHTGLAKCVYAEVSWIHKLNNHNEKSLLGFPKRLKKKKQQQQIIKPFYYWTRRAPIVNAVAQQYVLPSYLGRRVYKIIIHTIYPHLKGILLPPVECYTRQKKKCKRKSCDLLFLL
jgi:hypothetical protein